MIPPWRMKNRELPPAMSSSHSLQPSYPICSSAVAVQPAPNQSILRLSSNSRNSETDHGKE